MFGRMSAALKAVCPRTVSEASGVEGSPIATKLAGTTRTIKSSLGVVLTLLTARPIESSVPVTGAVKTKAGLFDRSVLRPLTVGPQETVVTVVVSARTGLLVATSPVLAIVDASSAPAIVRHLVDGITTEM